MFGRRIIVLSRLAALGQLIQAASNAFQYSHDAGPVETNVFGFSIGVGAHVHDDVLTAFQLVQPADALTQEPHVTEVEAHLDEGYKAPIHMTASTW